MQKFIADDLARQVQEVFKDLAGPVKIALFSSDLDCRYCPETRQLLEEVAALSDKITLDIYDLEKDADVAARYRVDKAPGFALLGSKDGIEIGYGIRFAGIPAGHEFTTLINALVLVSTGNSALSEETRGFLKGLNSRLTLQVFTTPT